MDDLFCGISSVLFRFLIGLVQHQLAVSSFLTLMNLIDHMGLDRWDCTDQSLPKRAFDVVSIRLLKIASIGAI